MSDKQPAAPRPVRSFVRREGRLTDGQRRALAELLPRYGVADQPLQLDLPALFGRRAPVSLEIGFGAGENLIDQAQAHPERDFLGIEVHRPGVGRLLLQIQQRGLENLRVLTRDAVEVLAQRIPAASLNEVLLYFPDPWPKKRHHKRRIVQPAFVSLVASRLAPGGRFHLATDWVPYAEWMLEVLSAEPLLQNTAADGSYVPRPATRSETRFERRGERLGHVVKDLVFIRRNHGPEQTRS